MWKKYLKCERLIKLSLQIYNKKSYSQNYGFALRYVWVEPLRNKTSDESKNALERVITKVRKPLIIYSDEGSEFMKGFQKYHKEQKILK